MKMKTIKVAEYESDEVEGNLQAFIMKLSETREAIPVEFRVESTIEFSSEYDSSSMTILIEYQRPYTDQELQEAEAQERVWRENRERADYNRFLELSARFGGPKP